MAEPTDKPRRPHAPYKRAAAVRLAAALQEVAIAVREVYPDLDGCNLIVSFADPHKNTLSIAVEVWDE